MTPEQTQQAFQDWMRSSQTFMQGFLGRLDEVRQSSPLFPQLPKIPSPDQSELAELQRKHLESHMSLWASLVQRKPGEVADPIVPLPAGDRRFSATPWASSPAFDYLRQAYLLNARFLSEVVDSLPITDRPAKNRLQFAMRQYVEAFSPSNFIATNPEVVQKALETKGESLRQGLLNLIGDVEKGRISMTDDTAFEVGRNLATTEGAVIFENEVMQLIQYTPTSEKVCRRPLLIIPPSINKYYILDLQSENSFVRYAVDQGLTVFLVSWRNPKAEQSKFTWDDYLDDGIFAALKIVQSVTKEEKPNILGFCIGGTLLASALAIAYARGEDPVESVTFLTTLLDFTDTGDLACFVDEQSVVSREVTIGQGGLMSGRELSNVFSSLRPNDLIWNYVVDNYLKGNKPPVFDLLYWNSDSTNVPGPFVSYYLRNTYLENNLRVPGKLTMLGQPVDLGKITCPAYFVATREDHIVPWRTSYLGRRLLGGETTFVLGASGHIAGVINPASKNKRSFWTNSLTASTSEEWMESAVEHKGSWWPNWIDWLKGRSGDLVAARTKLGSREYKTVEAAPGRYVKERI